MHLWNEEKKATPTPKPVKVERPTRPANGPVDEIEEEVTRA
jgi:hypothetical protein